MIIKARGAFKFTSTDACTTALAQYEEGGYGALAASDWEQAESYAFIDREVEIDADMESWRACFEEVAAAAQLGEVDLAPGGEATFVRLARAKGKKKVAVSSHRDGFGEPHQARVTEWAAAVDRVRQAKARAQAKLQQAREADEAAARPLIVARLSVGARGAELLVDGETAYVLTGDAIAAIEGDRIAWRHPAAGWSMARLAPGVVAVWNDNHPELTIARAEGATVLRLPPPAAEPTAEAGVHDVLPGRPGEVIVRERTSLRRLDLRTGQQLGALPFAEDSMRSAAVQEWPPRPVVGRSLAGVRLAQGRLAFARTIDSSDPDNDLIGELLVVTADLTEEYRLPIDRRLRSVHARNGKLFVVVSRDYTASLHPVTRRGLGKELLQLESYTSVSTTPFEGGFMVSDSGKTLRCTDRRTQTLHHGLTAPRVADIQGDHLLLAPLTHGKQLRLLDADGEVSRYEVDVILQGAACVGSSLIGWGYGGALYRVRTAEPGGKCQRLLAHRARLVSARALGDQGRLVSLDEAGDVIVWNLADKP